MEGKGMSKKNWQRECHKKQKFWQEHIKSWEDSGLSQSEYCRLNNLISNRFCYWKKKITRSSKKSQSFVPVPVSAVNNFSEQTEIAVYDSGLTILLDNNIKIRLENNFNPATLSRAVVTLGGLP
jgi:hypothetical protein